MPRTALPIGTWGRISAKKQENGQWRAHARYRGFDGKTVPVNKFGPTQGKAKTRLLEELRSRSSDMDSLSADTTVAVFASHWLESVEAEGEVRPQTIGVYRSHVNRLIVPALGDLKMREVTVRHCELFIRSQVSDNAGHARAAMCAVVLSGIMGYGVRHRAISSNPVRDAGKAPKKESTPVRALAMEDVNLVRAAVHAWVNRPRENGPRPSPALSDLIEIMLGSGLRIGEALALRWEDIDLKAERPTISVTGTLVKKRGGGLERQAMPKSDDSRRTVIAPDFVVDILMQRMVSNPLENPINAVFVNRKGSWLAPTTMNTAFRTALETAGLDSSWITPRVFRRTVATIIAEEMDDEQARRQLGHGNVKVTRKHYIQRQELAPDVRQALDKLAPSASLVQAP